MGTTADKLNKLLNTKQAIKQAIIDKGVDVSDDTKFADYPAKINSIESGSGGGGDPYYENMWNASTMNGTNYSYLFYGTDGPYGFSLDVSDLDTSKTTDMSNMFYLVPAHAINVSNFDTSKVTDMSYMFGSCVSLTSLDLSNFDTSNVTNMKYMFYGNDKMTSLDISSFNTSKVTDMSSMFGTCNGLTELNLNHFDISNTFNINSMFYNNTGIKAIDVSSWDVGHITSYPYFYSIFSGCTSLVDLYPPQNINTRMDLDRTTALSHDSLMRVINNLMTKTSTTQLKLGATNLAKLSDEEKAIATNKGWTLS